MTGGHRARATRPPSDRDLDDLVRRALAEDVGSGDVTTRCTVPPDRRARGAVLARAPLVVAGVEVARRVFELVDPAVVVEPALTDGDAAAEGDVVLRLEGPAAAILTGERTALNFLGHLCGVATLTRAYVEAVGDLPTRVIDTRKTTPGLRALEKAAVRAGGGANHRMGLYDMVLIKENHIAAAGGIEAALAAVRERDPGVPVEIEVRDLDELDRVLAAGGAERVMLDNMDLASLREAVARCRARPDGGPRLEASGGITLATVRAVAETGVDFVSVGALTHSAPAADLTLLIDP
ncbi:MAG: carboxylating nicotinate-nucleotide diphosphorylase [Gemmatimonadetes bacterium]|nr:MAG: carboxylating nicotinate-nucleotide diphosphorylase [Gemmatimonadota bacterium]